MLAAGWAAAVPLGRPPSQSAGHYGHFFRPPGDVSLFCPGEHLPDPFVSGLPAPLPSLIAADATPLAARAMHDASTTMRFFTVSPPLAL